MRSIVEPIPSMSPDEVEELVDSGPTGDGTYEWGGCTPDEVEYGATLSELAQLSPFLNDLIEAAAAAGRIGVCDTGMAVLVRGASILASRYAREAHAKGVDGDALPWLRPQMFLQVIALAEDCVSKLEDQTADFLRHPANEDDRRASGRWSADLAAADRATERANRARDRAESVRADLFARDAELL